MIRERKSNRNVLSFGPRFDWRNMVAELRKIYDAAVARRGGTVSVAIMVKELTDKIAINDLRVVLLSTGKDQNRATICRPVLDLSGDVRIGGAPIYTVDNRCPPKGKAQAYRSIKKDPNRIIRKT